EREHTEESSELCDQPVLIEISCNLRIKAAQIHDRQIGVDARQCAADQCIGILLRTVEVDNNGIDEHGLRFTRDHLGFLVAGELLRKWAQENRVNFFSRIVELE